LPAAFRRKGAMMIEINKIYNTDCREGMKFISDNSVDLVITSPPYNVGINYNTWNDNLSFDDYIQFTKEWLIEVYRILKDDGRIALNILYEINIKERGGRILLVSEYYQLMKHVGFNFAGIVDLIENAPHRVKYTSWGSWLSPSAPYIYNPKECVLLMYKKQWKKKYKGKSYFSNDNKEEFMELTSGMWKYRAETRKLTEANFSLDLPLSAIKILSFENDLVLDPFMGSGTTAIACINTNRNYIGFELNKEYYEIAKNRINKHILDNDLQDKYSLIA